jgi:hypothetical protein
MENLRNEVFQNSLNERPDPENLQNYLIGVPEFKSPGME